MKHFIWLAMHHGLPTNAFRVRCHVVMDESCQRCGAPCESLLHALRDCPRITCIWNILGFQFSGQFLIDDPGLWIKLHATSEKGCLFTICCWIIWKSRNAEIFTDCQWATWKITNNIKTLLEDSHKAFGSTTGPRRVRMVSWHPPLPN